MSVAPGRYVVLEPTVWYLRSQAITFMGRTTLHKDKALSMASLTRKTSGLERGPNHLTMIGDISQRHFPMIPLVYMEVGNMPKVIMICTTHISPIMVIGM